MRVQLLFTACAFTSLQCSIISFITHSNQKTWLDCGFSCTSSPIWSSSRGGRRREKTLVRIYWGQRENASEGKGQKSSSEDGQSTTIPSSWWVLRESPNKLVCPLPTHPHPHPQTIFLPYPVWMTIYQVLLLLPPLLLNFLVKKIIRQRP